MRANSLIALLLLLTCCQKAEEKKLVIAAAANAQFAMERIVKEFTSETGIPCEITLGSSGNLTTQIKAGAPFDVFVSADIGYPEELRKAGFALHTPEVYTFGKLVLWTTNDSLDLSFETFLKNSVTHIAIANPETAPYGRAAIEALQATGMYNKIGGKLVYGESISQVNQFITSGSAQMGFTSKSVVMSPQMKDRGKWTEINSRLYTPIAQGAVLLKRKDGNKEEAEKFYKFLFSAKAKAILNSFGYQSDYKP